MTRGHSSSLSSSVATRARMGLRVAPIVNSTSGLATAFKNHSGSRSSPPFDATSTNRSPSTTGAVRTVDRARPDFRPTTCSSTTVIPNAEPPIRPPLMRRTERCTKFRVRKPLSTMSCFPFTSRTYRVPSSGDGNHHRVERVARRRPLRFTRATAPIDFRTCDIGTPDVQQGCCSISIHHRVRSNRNPPHS